MTVSSGQKTVSGKKHEEERYEQPQSVLCRADRVIK